jgi:hypothetical protein
MQEAHGMKEFTDSAKFNGLHVVVCLTQVVRDRFWQCHVHSCKNSNFIFPKIHRDLSSLLSPAYIWQTKVKFTGFFNHVFSYQWLVLTDCQANIELALERKDHCQHKLLLHL